MQRLVSVVIPVLNGVKYLGEAIASVLANASANGLSQACFDIEVIVVDNGSTDGSQALAESFGTPVRVLCERQPGAAQARNSGVKFSRGEYLAFLDADDLWRPGKLSRQLQELDARKDLGMVFTFGENFLSPDLTEAQRKAVFCEPGSRPFILPSGMLARYECFTKVGPLPDLREGEFIAWYGLAVSIGIQTDVIPESFVLRRVHMSNSTRLRTYPADLLRAAKMVLDHKKGL